MRNIDNAAKCVDVPNRVTAMVFPLSSDGFDFRPGETIVRVYPRLSADSNKITAAKTVEHNRAAAYRGYLELS